MLAGELCWRRQLPLAEHFALEIVDRAGYGHSQRVSPGEDLDTDAPLVAALLADGAHLVGQSSGAVAAMLAASLRPEAVLSLTLCEPPAFQLAPGSAQAQHTPATPRNTWAEPAATRSGCADFWPSSAAASRFPTSCRPRWRRG